MHRAAAGNRAGLRRTHIARAALAAGCLAALPALGQDGFADAQAQALAPARAEAPVRLEVQPGTLPGLNGQEAGFRGLRLDLAILPAGGHGMGVVVGMAGHSPEPALPPGLAAPARPGVDLGLRYRHALAGQRQVDVTAWRRMQAAPDAQGPAPLYGARVEMRLRPARGPLAFDRGFLGLQLQGGARISVKRRHGGTMVYYRQTF